MCFTSFKCMKGEIKNQIPLDFKLEAHASAVLTENLFSPRTMTGIEYEVLHVQDPILYVIRKQHRISPTQGWLQLQYHSRKYAYTNC